MRELTSAQRPTVARSVIRTMTAYVTKASSALMKVSDSTIPVRDRMLARSALIDMLLPVPPDACEASPDPRQNPVGNRLPPMLFQCDLLRSRGHVFETVLRRRIRSEEHTSELQSLMRISYAVFCLKKKK